MKDAHVTVNGCLRCGAKWDLHEELAETGVSLPAVLDVAMAALRVVGKRLTQAHRNCADAMLVEREKEG